MLSRDRLVGIWAGLPVPWNEDGSINENILRKDVARCCEVGVHGVYTGGTTGEWYAQNFEEFKQITTATLDEAHKHNTPVQVGVTAVCTRDVVERAKFAMDAGADALQVALPSWMALCSEEIVTFFKDIDDACPGAPIVNYSTMRSKRALSAADYKAVLAEGVNLIGAKSTAEGFSELIGLMAAVPEVNFLVGEHLLMHAMMHGAKGSCSSLVYMSPKVILRLYDACASERWAEALEITRQICKLFFGSVLSLLDDKGLLDSAVDRALGRSLGFLQAPLTCKKPYRSATEEDVAAIRKWVEQNLPEEWREVD
jgi:dihydrodipicolinate synthase/N-acetylneuraminate lyase